MKYPQFIMIPLLVLLINVLSCTKNGNSLVVRSWQILHEHNATIDTADQNTGWKPIVIPSTFKVPDPLEKDFKFVWLRAEFDIPGNPEDYYGISTGRIRYSDEIYINKQLVGSLSPRKVNLAPMPRDYVIPKGFLRSGRNTVHIKLGIYDKYFGGILNDVLIESESDFDKTQLISNLLYEHLPLGIVVLFAGCAIILLISYFSDRKEKLYIFAFILALDAILYTFLPIFSHQLINYESCYAIQFFSIVIILISFMLIFQSIYRIYLSNYNLIYVPLLIFFIILIFLFRDESYNSEVGFIIVITSVIISILYFIVMMYHLRSINPDKFLFSMVCIMFVMVLYIICSEVYLAVVGGLAGERVVTFTPIVFIILGAIVSSREIKKRKRELENVYDKLKKLEGKEISITDTLEIKLKRVIGFIDENYTSDLSREGLAAAVGIHPNYFGRLFKLYTSRTINEYINHLRIEDAVRKLSKKESKVIDIAFEVGFESIVTFNRAFKKEIRKTPTEFREGIKFNIDDLP